MATTQIAPVNYWPESACAEAFWGQKDVPPYRQLLADTTAWLDPRPGDRWLDLGCGSGQLTRALWEKSAGRVAAVIGMDCAAANALAFEDLGRSVQPPPTQDQIRFQAGNFSQGLAAWGTASFDGVVSGLAIQYAESFSPERGRWTTAAYDHLLREVWRVLRAGGTFVFSVNVPEPDWRKVAMRSWKGLFLTARPLRFLRRSWRMMRYGGWLSREARRGRFHYLPLPALVEKLTAAGFTTIEHRRSYAGQAYLLRCRKPGGA